jgi:hypothetical protein
MSAALEAALARLYADADALALFLREPQLFFDALGLSETDRAALRAMDRVGLRMAARSFAGKRARRGN